MGNYTSNKTANAKIRAKITETERNLGIYHKYTNGSYSKAGLARMYRLSDTRIGQIIKKISTQQAQTAPVNDMKEGQLNG